MKPSWKVGQRAMFAGQVVEILSVQRQDFLGDAYFTLFFKPNAEAPAAWHLEAYVIPLEHEAEACES